MKNWIKTILAIISLIIIIFIPLLCVLWTIDIITGWVLVKSMVTGMAFIFTIGAILGLIED